MKQRGFTLIELVVVIVILGILAATALPKFVDLSGDAEQAATSGVASAVSSWGVVNYGARKAGNAAGKAITDTTDACAGAANSVAAANTADAILQGSVSLVTAAPANTNQYQIAGGTPKVCGAGVTVQCTITHSNGKTATAFVPCTT